MDAAATAAARAGKYPPDFTRNLAARADYLTIPPRVQLAAGTLRVWWGGGWEAREATDRLLVDFIALADSDDAGVLAFAKQWGVLSLCRHGIPREHDESCHIGSMSGPDQDGAFPEHVGFWFAWARRMREVFNAIIAVRSGRRPDPFDPRFWDAHIHKSYPRADLVSDPIVVWLCVVGAINRWVDMGRVAPILQIVNDEPRIVLGHPMVGEGATLLGALALQMMLFAVDGEAIEVCEGCKRPFFVVGRRRNPNRKRWCPACGKRAANVLARRRYREKQKVNPSRHAKAIPRKKGARRGAQARKR
jgi:hypothetical protein